MKKILFLFAWINLIPFLYGQTLDHLALTPPMGWNSWNFFHCDVNEMMIMEMADAMVSSGLKDAGYKYIVIDDCWQIDRNEKGVIIADPAHFPSGIKALADYVHSKGLKFGLYSDAGTHTCQRRPGSKGYEYIDAATYAKWNVDYLKYDWCNTDGQDTRVSYQLMRDALDAAGRPIVFSICEWGSTQPWLWAQGIGHLWRTTGDIQANWNSVMNLLDRQVGLEKYSGPGGWNDPDMLEVGNGNLTYGENKAHFSLWCLLNAPLMAGNDLRNMTAETIEILTNKEVISVNQDSLGVQGKKIRDDGHFEVWAKPMKDGSEAVILLNRSKIEKNMTVSWKELDFPENAILLVRDLWKHQDAGYFPKSYSVNVLPHDAVMLRLWQKESVGQLPKVGLISPKDNSTLKIPANINLTAKATGSDGKVLQVSFLVNGKTIGTDTDSKNGWTQTWTCKIPGIYQIQAYAMDNANLSSASIPVQIYLAPEKGPYLGDSEVVPGKIQMENYDGGGEGIGYHDSDKMNQGGQYRWDGVDIDYTADAGGGYFVGWLKKGEWLNYSVNIPETEMYDISLRYAAISDNGKCHFQLGNQDITGPIAIPKTKNEDEWKNILIKNIQLPQGTQNIKFYVDQGGFNINMIDVDFTLRDLPSPWMQQDVGETDILGNAGIRKDCMVIESSGRDIWRNQDEFHFVYQKVEGDAEIIAKVLSVEETNAWAKAGVMIRDSLTADSKNAFMLMSASNGTTFQRRLQSNDGTRREEGDNATGSYWVRLVREGNLFTGYNSPDGQTWQKIGAVTIDMQKSVYAGLAVTSHDDNALCEARFDNIKIRQINQ